MKPRKFTPRPVIIKIAKSNDKERILKAGREKKAVTCKENPVRLSDSFSAGIL